MIFWGALLTLIWDQLSPLHRPTQFDRLFVRYSDWVLHHFNAGTHSHGLLAWTVAALIPALLVGLVGLALGESNYFLGLAWGALVLYQCLGFRQISQLADELQSALHRGDQKNARLLLVEFGLDNVDAIPAQELNRVAVAQVLQLGLSRVYGPLFWFMLLGPFGAVAHALSTPLAERWRGDTDFRVMIGRILNLLDWLPVRLLAFSFAIVGNFEEAMLSWRSNNSDDTPSNAAILQAAGFGALGMDDTSPDPDYVSGAAALLKRAALVWLALLGLLWLGGL
ncbi:MAG: regulatory signaling modulator protein AmpE [Parasulfuritortus sp.]|jgi:adenosylcobinamide-phosphate synthase|nr:regulatory signaling modulator protein AmpE [Parasulfuritortus sp.]